MLTNFRWVAALIIGAVAAFATPVPGYYQTNLVSDIPGMAAVTDPNLQNPWGLSQGPTPIWISDNGTNVSTLYSGKGQPVPLVVSIPGGAPTGQVFNGNASAFNGDRFLFASEAGMITGWRGALGTSAETLSDQSGAGAIFKGLASAQIGTDAYLYGADFGNSKIFVLPSAGAPALTGTFTDPNLPAGYAPFNIQNIGGQLYVSYARKLNSTDTDETAGPGLGYVDIFDVHGVFQKRLISNGPLNAPWGLAMAPSNWGPFSNDLLVGNFGDGWINAFDPNTGAFRGALSDMNGTAIVNDGLWGLMFGNDNATQKTSARTLYFTAGLNDEANGLFGAIQPTPEPATSGLVAVAIAGLALLTRKRAR